LRLLVTADWQASLKNLDRCEVVVDQILSILSKYPGTYVLHLGDIKDSPRPEQHVTNFLVHAVARIHQSSKGFLFVRGNHDNAAQADGSPSFSPLIDLLNVSCVASDDWNGYQLAPNCDLWMVPYFRDSERQKNAFQDALVARMVSKSKHHILAFHNEIAGCDVSFSRKGTGLSLDDIGAKYYDLCLGGHIHKPQHIKPNLYYVGSPFAVDWSEANYEHRFMMVEV